MAVVPGTGGAGTGAGAGRGGVFCGSGTADCEGVNVGLR